MNDKPLTDGVSWALPSRGGLLLENGHPHFELVDPVFEEEDFPGVDVGVSGSQSFQASFANSSGESGGEQGGSDEQ